MLRSDGGRYKVCGADQVFVEDLKAWAGLFIDINVSVLSLAGKGFTRTFISLTLDIKAEASLFLSIVSEGSNIN